MKLDEIDDLLEDRGKTHGCFSEQSLLAGTIKAAMERSRNWGELEHDQAEALDMIAVKIARLLTGNPHHHDGWLDICGYAKLIADRLKAGKR